MSDSATDTTSPAAITVYWRPGCGFCRGLFADLDRLQLPYDKIDIWENPDAAAFVRSVARGNEVVPTVTVGSKSFVNPSAREVLQASKA